MVPVFLCVVIRAGFVEGPVISRLPRLVGAVRLATMAKRRNGGEGGMMGWLLRKLVTTPATWIGLAAGVAVGRAFAEVSGMGGGIGMGTLVGVGAGVASWALYRGIRSAYSKDRPRSDEAGQPEPERRERAMASRLRAVGLTEDADVFSKMLEARDAVRDRWSREEMDTAIGAPTVTLIDQLIDSVLPRLEELLDLTRRVEDPLLETPSDATETVQACRDDLVQAYRAIADCRSRILLRHDPELLLDEPSVQNAERLRTLTAQLREETSVMERVDRRLRGIDSGASPESRLEDAGSSETIAPPSMESEG